MRKDTKEAPKGALAKFVKDQAKKLGADALESLAKTGVDMRPEDFLSTGIPALDGLLGGYGVKKGSITLLVGGEGSGKTSAVYHMIAEAQKEGPVLMIDAECTWNNKYAQDIGVCLDEDKLIYNQPTSGEKAYQLALDAIESGAFALVAIDSVAAMLTEKQLDNDMGGIVVGGAAKLNTEGLLKMQPMAARKKVPVVLVSQYRDNIGAMGNASKNKIAGGRALRYTASNIISVTYTGQLRQGDLVFGQTTKLQLMKCKQATPRNHVTVTMVYGKGYDPIYGIYETALDTGVISKGGSWLSFDKYKAQGAPGFVELMRKTPELVDAIKEKMNAAKN